MVMAAKTRKVYVSQEFADGTVDRKRRMLESVARILSQRYGVVVIFSPTGECSTNTERMILPYEKNVDECLLLGLAGHETGHLKDTDFDIRADIANYPGILNRPFLFRIFNALEDVRIEFRMEEDYEGFKNLFRRMIPYIREEKERIIKRTRLKQWMTLREWDFETMAVLLSKFDSRELEAVRTACKDAGLSEQFIEREVGKTQERLNGDIPTTMMILDVIYLSLRGYGVDWYPRVIREFIEDMNDILNPIYQCDTSQEVLEIAVEVYKAIEEAIQNPQSRLNQGRGKGQPIEGEEGKGDDESKGIIVGERILTVGSKVHHLHDASRVGTIVEIDKDSQEVKVEWDT